MILVDTSIWVDHLRSGLPQLTAALQKSAVLIHPWVIGELACGNLRDRSRVATPAEVLTLIEQQHLMGRGIGFVDAQLLTSARLTHCTLWTQDHRRWRPAPADFVHHKLWQRQPLPLRHPPVLCLGRNGSPPCRHGGACWRRSTGDPFTTSSSERSS